jgi:hypothetical protein
MWANRPLSPSKRGMGFHVSGGKQKGGRDMQRIQKAERRRSRLYRPRKANELLYLQVTLAGASNIVYVLANVFIAILYSSSNAHTPAPRDLPHC